MQPCLNYCLKGFHIFVSYGFLLIISICPDIYDTTRWYIYLRLKANEKARLI